MYEISYFVPMLSNIKELIVTIDNEVYEKSPTAKE